MRAQARRLQLLIATHSKFACTRVPCRTQLPSRRRCRRLCEQEVRAALSDHDRGDIGVGAGNARQRRGVAPHRDAASGMAGGDRGFSNACLHIGTRAWEKFRPDSGCDRLGGDDFPCPFQRAHQRIDVVALGSNAPVLGSARITAARDSLHQLRGDINCAATVAPRFQHASTSALVGLPITTTVSAAFTHPSPAVMPSMARRLPRCPHCRASRPRRADLASSRAIGSRTGQTRA